MKPSIVLAVLVGHLSTSVYAWKLHESCKKTGYEKMVTDNMDSAFKMAKAASTAIQLAIDGSEESNSKNEDVLKWMFLKKNESVKNNKKLKAAKDVYDNVVGQNKTLPTDPQKKLFDFVVFCDLERFKEIEGGKYLDTENDATLSASEYKDTHNACARKRDFSLAVTEDPDYCNGQVPSQMQLCPWFLDWMKNRDENTEPPKGHRASALEKTIIPVLKDKTGNLAEIDSRSLFDKVLLHEITHTRGSGTSNDVGDKRIIKIFTIKYGWKRCRELAEKGYTDHKRASYRNADSLALAASAIRFNDEGLIVQENGSITDC